LAGLILHIGKKSCFSVKQSLGQINTGVLFDMGSGMLYQAKELTAKIIGVRMTASQLHHIEKQAGDGSMSNYIRALVDKDIKRVERAEKTALRNKKKAR